MAAKMCGILVETKETLLALKKTQRKKLLTAKNPYDFMGPMFNLALFRGGGGGSIKLKRNRLVLF